MHSIQVFFVVVLSGFVSITIILGLALVEKVAIFDKGWRIKERVQAETIHYRSVRRSIEDGWVYARNWNFGERIKNGKIYPRHRNFNGHFGNGRIYERDWARRSA